MKTSTHFLFGRTFPFVSKSARSASAVMVLLALTTACVSRAPSGNVMGSGTVFAPSLNAAASSGRSERPRIGLAHSGANEKSDPRRTQPWVEKVWVYDQELAGQTYFQGTYVFLEVQPSQWSPAGEGKQ